MPDQYTIQPNDTLQAIADIYGIDVNTLIAANPGIQPYYLTIGQSIQIPVPVPGEPGSSLKLIPDSELVASPYTIGFAVSPFVFSQNGYLKTYSEKVNEVMTSGADIVSQVAQEYSINPRLLLAVLEYQSGWVTRKNISSSLVNYPMGYFDPDKVGLYRQLSLAANLLNKGFYLWDVNAISHWTLPDGSMVPISLTINAGTAGIQYLMSRLHNRSEWDAAVGSDGVLKVYEAMFGTPFKYAFEPLTPSPLIQPVMQLPFESGTLWSFTGGPHSGWGDGSAWAALDFAPPDDTLGCNMSVSWVTAVADGLVVRSANGVMVIDLDYDGYEQTGWTVLYLHIASEDRVAQGTYIKSGGHIGHPSCEGGVADASHVHLARRYNGKWISADGPVPFIMDGWISSGTGTEYDGYLTKNNVTVVAWNDPPKLETKISR